MKNVKMDNVKELWAAGVVTPSRYSDNIDFRYASMKIKERVAETKTNSAMIVTEDRYLIGAGFVTQHFYNCMLGVEYEIGDGFLVFYSDSKEECIEWLSKKREKLIAEYKDRYERFLRSKIEEKATCNSI